MENFYFFSIQIYFTGSALISVFFFFKLQRLTDILIGDGHSAYIRQKEKREKIEQKKIHKKDLEPLIDEKLLNRLRDAIYRKNIYGIEEGLINLKNREIYKGLEKPTGYKNHVYKKYKKAMKIYENLLLSFKIALIIAFFGLILNLFLILFNVNIDALGTFLSCLIEYGNFVLIFSYFITIFWIICYSTFKKTPHELEKIGIIKNNQ